MSLALGQRGESMEESHISGLASLSHLQLLTTSKLEKTCPLNWPWLYECQGQVHVALQRKKVTSVYGYMNNVYVYIYFQGFFNLLIDAHKYTLENMADTMPACKNLKIKNHKNP